MNQNNRIAPLAKLLGLWLALAWSFASAAVSGAGPSPSPPEPARAELLYETHCTGCHTSVAHLRPEHRAHTAAEVSEQVRRWSGNQHLAWSDSDIDEVTGFLVRRYYRFAPQTQAPAKP